MNMNNEAFSLERIYESLKYARNKEDMDTIKDMLAGAEIYLISLKREVLMKDIELRRNRERYNYKKRS